MVDEGRRASLSATAEFRRVLGQRPSPWRVIIATAAAVVALAAGRELFVAPPGTQPELVAPNDENAKLTALLVDDHARERGDRQRALQALTELRIASQALALARKRYVDPSRVDARKMLQAALAALSHAVPPMLVESRREAVEIRLGGDHLKIDLQEMTDLFRLDRALLLTTRFLSPRLPPEVPAAELEYLAVNGALQTLDPYTRMLDPDAWREMRTHTGGQFGGLGIRILVVEGVLTVVGVIEGSPAALAGMKDQDQILRINGQDTLNMAVDDAVDLLRGEVGTKARLWVRRTEWPEPREVVLARAVIQLSSVEGRVLDNGIAYAKVKGFQRGTAKELAAFLDTLPKPRRGLLLDLRGNPGGLLDEAVALVSLFLDSGVVVSTVGASQTQDARPVRPGGTALDLPLALLIDRRSASASEIVAGALQVSGRALLIGERSFGKGTVQVPFEIGDGALKLTVAQYLVGDGVVIQERGVMPDVAIDFVSVLRDRVSLFDADASRRRAEAEAHGQRASHRLRVLVPLASERRPEELASPALFHEAEPTRRASELLRRAGAPSALAMLPKLRVAIAEAQQADAVDLHRALARVGVNWRAGPRSPDPRVRLQVANPAESLVMDAGKTLPLSVTVTNRGPRALYRVHLRSRCDAPAFEGAEAVVGRLGAGQSRTVTLRLRTAHSHLDLAAPVQVVALSDGSPLGAETEALVTMRGRARPTLAFRYALVAPDAIPAGGEIPPPMVLRPGRTALLHVEVRNEGPGPSRATEVTLRSLAGAHLILRQGRADLGRLDPGQRAVALLELTGGQSDGEPAGLLEARLQVGDGSTGWSRQSRIYLPWEPAPPQNATRKRQVPAAVDLPIEASRLVDVAARRWNRPPALRLLPSEGEIDTPLAEATTESALSAEAVDADRVDGSPDVARIAPLTAPCRLRLRAAARFEADGPIDRYVTISVDGKKRIYHDARGFVYWTVDDVVVLDSGLARVTIVAHAGVDRVASRTLLAHCRAPPAPTTAQRGVVPVAPPSAADTTNHLRQTLKSTTVAAKIPGVASPAPRSPP